MSSVGQQEDLADSNKDEENNTVSAITSDISSSGCGAATSSNDIKNLDVSDSNTLKHSSSVSEYNDGIPPLSPNKSIIEKSKDGISDDTNKLGVNFDPHTSSASSASVACEDNQNSQKNAIESEILTMDTLSKENVLSLSSTSNEYTNNDNIGFDNASKPIADTIGYKETTVDDDSDSDIELRWTDDEDDIQSNTQPLRENALKQLDKDLGIVDASKNIDESIQIGKDHDVEIIKQGPKVIESSIEPMESDKMVVRTVSDLQPLDNDVLKNLDQELGTADESIDKAVEELEQLIGQENAIVQQKPNVTEEKIASIVNKSGITKICAKDVDSISVNVHESSVSVVHDCKPIDDDALKHLDEVHVKSADGEIDKTVEKLQDFDTNMQKSKVNDGQNNLSDSASVEMNAKHKDQFSMDVNVLSVEGESIVSETSVVADKPASSDTSLHNKKLKELDMKLDVDENNKISEIDIDETIVDLKHLIDQDEDTVKQLGLDVGSTDNVSVNKTVEKYDKQKPIIIEEQVKSFEGDLGTANISIQEENVEPMDIDISTKIGSSAVVTNINTTSIIFKLETEPLVKTENNVITKPVSIPKNDEISKTVTKSNDHNNEKNDIAKSGDDCPTAREKNGNCSENVSKNSLENVEIICQDDITPKDPNTEDKSECADKTSNNDDTISKERVVIENTKKDSIALVENIDLQSGDNTNISDESNVPDIGRIEIKENVLKDKTEKANISEVDKFVTSNVTNDSIKINTEHRINRPDVMLDIPTQEFDFDHDFDRTPETIENETSSDKHVNNNSNITAKTVTEIVELAKNKEAQIKDISKITVANVDKPQSTLDKAIKEKEILNVVQNQEKLSDKMTEKETASDDNSKKTDEILEKETNRSDNKTPISPTKTDENSQENNPKTVEPTENVDTQETDVSKPSTSEGTKMSPDNADEVQEVTDTLGLLAESSRVMDEDDDDDEQEADEDDGEDGDGDDEDDDFDPDDEESNPTAEHSEESNPPHSELDIQEERIDIVYENEADVVGLVSDSNDVEDKFNDLLGVSTDITVEENDPVPTEPFQNVDDIDTFEEMKLDTDTKDADAETDKETSTSEAAKKPPKERRKSILADLLSRNDDNTTSAPDGTKKSPDKLKNLMISQPNNIVNIVELEESSSEEDIQLNKKSDQEAPPIVSAVTLDKDVTSVCKNVLDKDKIADGKPTEAATKDISEKDDKGKAGEIFNLDSDDDDKGKSDLTVIGKPRENNQCINHNCMSDESVPYYLADRVTIAYYGAARRRRRAVCQNCLDVVNSRNEGLVSGIKDLRPLMSLRMARPTQQLLEISDSDSEGEDDPVGEGGAKLIEEQLTDLINGAWSKYKMDDRLKETEDYLEAELEKMQKQSEEIDQLLKDCQKATDKLRVEFYSGFEPQRKELPALSLHDTPIASYACLETDEDFNERSQLPLRYPKRRSTTAIDTPAKKQAIPMGYTDADGKKVTRASSAGTDVNADDDKDVSVVRLSAESAPADLPPPGEIVKPQLKVGAQVYAMKNQYGAWLKAKVVEIMPKVNDHQFTPCRVRFDHKLKNPCKLTSLRFVAYTEPSDVRMTIGTRVIALFVNSDTSTNRDYFYYSGVIAEIPNPVNSYRYLVFFDDGYVQYVAHRHTRLVCESSALVWEEVHPYSRDFVSNYLLKYPERPMVRMHPGQGLTVEWNGKWWETKVKKVDAALVCVSFPDGRREWIYRGSTRLQPLFTEFQAARRGDRARLPRSTKANTKTNMPYVEYTRSDGQTNKAESQEPQFQSAEELRRQRAVAKKSTTLTPQTASPTGDGLISRVVFYTPKNSVRPYKMVPHTCGPQCNRSDLLSLQELRTYNPLTKPLLSGWERQIIKHKLSREIMYRAPCGRRLRSMRELHRYLRAVASELSVDLFDFNPNTHCLAEFVLNQTNVQKKDLSHGKENVPVPCVNYYDHSLPEFCSYNTERTPTAGVPLNLDPEFLCGCDCDDDCADKTKCACWKMTLEGARTIGIEGPNIGYEYRRLPEPLPSGIYECNSRCKCKSTCLNRVVQNPLQLKLQVFKTLNRGWGIRALNDVPKGSFLCIYAGNLLTDATANLDGLNEGDEYLAELDYIEVVEAMKEGYEEDIPESIKKLDKKELEKSESEPETESSESEEETSRDSKSDKQDDDFQPGYVALGNTEFNKRLRRRDKNKKGKENEKTKEDKEEADVKSQITKETGEECITISDDEEVRVSQREPSRFTAQESMTDSKVVPKYRSIRTYFGKDEACYIMDAKVQGNIGRYLNHSCTPNVFVQNVFVDTHDPRFPWVSFFALQHIRAGTELTWNYNYDIGSVPGKVLYCFCGASNCRGRLL